MLGAGNVKSDDYSRLLLAYGKTIIDLMRLREGIVENVPDLVLHPRNKEDCGHFPQSFEFSCVGGWVVTRGAGQNSTYFGKIEDMVICQEYITPVGEIKTGDYPATSTGPSIDDMMMGSEGAYGILTSVTLKIFKYMPENQRRFSYMFKNWEDAMYTTGLVTKGWEKGRFKDPYMREDLKDYGIMTDTLECAVTWDTMSQVHKEVKAFCKSRPNTICMTHMSHVYPQGANLYFIFIAKINEIDEYLDYQYGILDYIQKSGAAMSHHHGIGKMTAPWLENQIGKNEMDILRCLKKHFDPNNIMNPGGTIGLDLPEKKRRKIKN